MLIFKSALNKWNDFIVRFTTMQPLQNFKTTFILIPNHDNDNCLKYYKQVPYIANTSAAKTWDTKEPTDQQAANTKFKKYSHGAFLF